MSEVVCLEGTFGSGKSHGLICRAFEELSKFARVVIITPTLNHQRDLQALFAKVISQPHTNFSTLLWETAPVFLAHQRETSVLSVSAAFVDDADYPIGYKWRMSDVVKHICSRRLPFVFLTCRSAAALSRALSVEITHVDTLKLSRRLDAVNHSAFIKALFTPKANHTNRLQQLPTLVPRLNAVEMASAALQAVTAVYTVILCEDEGLLRTIFKMAPAWNENRRSQQKSIVPVMHLPTNTNQFFEPCSLQLSTIANFFGRERRHVVVVFPDHKVPMPLFVEALTRHTSSLTIVFSANDAPAPLHNVLWMTDVANENDLFLDSSSSKRICSEPKVDLSVTTLVQKLVDDSRNVEDALDSVKTLINKHDLIITTDSQFMQPWIQYTGPSLPTNIERALGSVVEAVVLHLLRGQDFCQSEAYERVSQTMPIWLDRSESFECMSEETLWRLTQAFAHLRGQTDVFLPEEFLASADTVGFFKGVVQNCVQCLPMAASRSQVPIKFGRYVGVIDAIVNGVVLELKHSLQRSTVSDYAIVQATIYALASGAERALALNMASGHVVSIEIKHS